MPMERQEHIAYILKNKQDMIEMKRNIIKYSESNSIAQNSTIQKSLHTNYEDDTKNGVINRKIVANTYLWADSHDDVHLPGIFSKSIAERFGKIWHLHDHVHQIAAKVGKLTNLYEQEVSWFDLGVNKFGKTTALFAESEIQKSLNPVIYREYLKGEINQHSVGMVYVKVDVAIDSHEDENAYANWNKYISLIGNPERVNEKGYFFLIKEAKLIEISAVLEGSNELTPTIENITPKSEPVILETKESDIEYLIKNFKLK
jgi:hypothetical protein